jgi:hypothetical protein
MTGKQIHFFATKEDLLPVLEKVESEMPLAYAAMERYGAPVPRVYPHGVSLPNLGAATNESEVRWAQFLVGLQGHHFEMRRVALSAGGHVYILGQDTNPDTVTLSPGGVWKPDVLLNGRVATLSETAVGLRLMTRFRSAIKGAFTRVRAFWVGPHAEAMLDQGARLTSAEQSPRIYDLKR